MKTLDEVIKAFSEAIKEVGCGDYQFNDAESDDIPCEMTDCIFTDVLHYLHEYREHRDQIDALPDYYDLVNFWAESQANLPLTWDELKTLQGKPVWVEMHRPGYRPWSGWEVIDHDGVGEKWMHTYRDDYAREQQGKTWQAYRKERE